MLDNCSLGGLTSLGNSFDICPGNVHPQALQEAEYTSTYQSSISTTSGG